MKRTMALDPGTPVQFTARLGAVPRGCAHEACGFVGQIEPGQTGLYAGPMLGRMGREGWHICTFGAWDVSCHRSHFTAAPIEGQQEEQP